MAEEKAKHGSTQKERVFVRPVIGKYSELLQGLYDRPRVIEGKKIGFPGEGPVLFNKFVLSPSVPDSPITSQAFEVHIEAMAPGGKSQKHGHMNSACVYVLEGIGYDIHDGKRLDWQAGDAYVIRNACIHQHFNSSKDKGAKVLIMKGKPLFLFLNLFFQGQVELPPDKVQPGYQGWTPTL